MFVYFEFDQECRKKIAKCFEVNVETLFKFFSDLEGEVGWYIALGGLRSDNLSAQDASSYLSGLAEKSHLLLEHLEKLPRSIFRWLVETIPMGVNYREPFRKILPLLQQITQLSSDANDNIDLQAENVSQVNAVDLIRRMERCYNDHSETPVDIGQELFERFVEIVFDAIGLDENPKQIILKTLSYKQKSAALSAEDPGLIRPERKPLGGTKRRTR